MVLRKMLVEILRSDELKHRIAQKFHALVGAEREVGKPDRPEDGFNKRISRLDQKKLSLL